MKTNKKAMHNQRSILEQKLNPWLNLRKERTPPSGWLSAIRGALGMSSRQLARLTDVDHSAIVRLENREKQRKVTLELLDKVANAMNCKLLYAIVPKDQYNSLDEIVEEKAMVVAKKIVQTAEHSMLLEAQGRKSEHLQNRIKEVASELKNQMDSKLWNEE